VAREAQGRRLNRPRLTPSPSVTSAHEGAMAELATVTTDEKRDPELSVIDVAEHIAQMSMHASAFFGHQQWYLFDRARQDQAGLTRSCSAARTGSQMSSASCGESAWSTWSISSRTVQPPGAGRSSQVRYTGGSPGPACNK
jgi:hypothetical protein